MKNINPTHTISWKNLKNHFLDIKKIKLYDLFQSDSKRFLKYSIKFEDFMILDFSKNCITEKTLQLLFSLAKECFVPYAIKSMFLGKFINKTENKPVLHVALRNKLHNSIFVNKKNIMLSIYRELEKIKNFSNSIIDGSWKGFTGKSISDVVNIGIGGSHLGPYMVTEALTPYRNHLNVHYVSNIDSTNLFKVLKGINLENTIFLISSKSFKTEETLVNAAYIKEWCLSQTSHKNFFYRHFFALSANYGAAIDFGIPSCNIFKFWNWVGGRYSVWSASGLSIVLAIGFKNFHNFLCGAYAMDRHFLINPLSSNIPVILAVLSIWYTNFFNVETEAVMPYDEYLHVLPSYLQQTNMESNGKSIDRHGHQVSWHTGPIVWGNVGTNGQHSFYQLLHQSNKIIPCDFIIPVNSHNSLGDNHLRLFSNFLAQTQALAFGQSSTFSNFGKKDNIKRNISDFLSIFKKCSGNKPSNSILIRKITPYTLGSLLALYEHKIFVQGVILNIYSFDQWGVELGKEIASDIYHDLSNDLVHNAYDISTYSLIKIYQNWSSKI